MKRVLVTGNLGYLGPLVTRRLHEAGHYVIGLDTGWYVNDYAEMPEWPDRQLYRDTRTPYLDVDVDAVVHLAGLSNDPLGELDPALTHDINVEGTLGIVRALPLARHIVISSSAVYGQTVGEATETSPPMPLTAYARGKVAVDAFLEHSILLDYASLRLGTLYGYSPGHRLDLVVNRMTYDAIETGTVTATGNAQRPLTHVEDAADAIAFAIANPEVRDVVNVIGENWRIADLARAVASFTGATAVFKPATADLRDYAASGAKLAALGWTAKRTVEGSLPVLAEKTYNLPPGKYERLHALKRLIASGRLDSSLRPAQRKSA